MNNTVQYIHTGLSASSEERADLFFCGILGLEKSEPKKLDKELVSAIFGVVTDLLMIHYRSSSLDFEVFIQPEYSVPAGQIVHTCIAVPDLKKTVARCRDAGLKVTEIPKGTAVITFVSDYDGNLYEVKE